MTRIKKYAVFCINKNGLPELDKSFGIVDYPLSLEEDLETLEGARGAIYTVFPVWVNGNDIKGNRWQH